MSVKTPNKFTNTRILNKIVNPVPHVVLFLLFVYGFSNIWSIIKMKANKGKLDFLPFQDV